MTGPRDVGWSGELTGSGPGCLARDALGMRSRDEQVRRPGSESGSLRAPGHRRRRASLVRRSVRTTLERFVRCQTHQPFTVRSFLCVACSGVVLGCQTHQPFTVRSFLCVACSGVVLGCQTHQPFTVRSFLCVACSGAVLGCQTHQPFTVAPFVIVSFVTRGSISEFSVLSDPPAVHG